MDDLISRSAVLESFAQHTARDSMKVLNGERLWAYEWTKSDMFKIVQNAPALDAVPVIRCNICKYYEQDTGFCQYWGCGNYWDGFCNKGARMDGEADV